MKRTNKSNETTNTTNDPIVISSVSVERVRDTNKGVFFTLVLNGIFIHNCKIVEGKNGDFISFPQYKGSDDKWYSYVWVRLSEADSNHIISLVEDELNN